MPPITAAISTPNALTPPRSSAAGGLEKVVEPTGFAALVEDVDDDGLLLVADAEPADEVEVEDIPGVDEALLLLSTDLLSAVLFTEVLVSDGEIFGVVEEAEDFAAPAPVEAEAAVPAALPDDAPDVSGFVPLAEDVDPVELLSSVALPGLASTFSAFRSMVTGRLEEPAVEDDLPVSGLSESPGPLPPAEDDAPPEDFLSVAICSPPGPQGLKTFTIHASLRSGTARQRLFRAAKHGLPRIGLTLR
ncbi:hypothetical protein [Roseibium aggregatum]|uniref:Uncharacterized protein n=1 Tax=Roseibium aggregatum TaxID=187304 RepID=A0A939J7M6_9HYPH|nr:hypothetical protein [Roseibium aggregatum]MBN9673994.1 hypothetical protein [Roseibium aggregatum]